MAQRTKAELLAEARRIGALYDAWREFQLTYGPPERAARMRETTCPSEQWFAGAGRGGPTLSQLIEGTRQAVNDASETITDAVEQGWPEGKGFLNFYRARTGRDWYDDAGDPAKASRAILKRGRIRNETEWYVLEGILTRADQAVFDPEEVERLGAMRRAFEKRAARSQS